MVRLSQVQRNLLILISRDCKLWISLISSKSLKSISETNGCAKMDIKGRERKRNEKGSVDLKIWTKVHGLRTGGTGFPKPAAPVSVGSAGYTRDLPGYSYLFTPFTPFSHPRLRIGEGEARGVISWRFEDQTVGFKD
jgi:hypothetical protein